MLEAKGDLWTYPANYRVITTNGIVVGKGLVMGRGCAYEAAQKFSDLRGFLGELVRQHGNKPYVITHHKIITLPTKHHWRDKSDLALIAKGVFVLQRMWEENMIRKVVMPRPGCGNGGLDWIDVKPILEGILSDDFTVIHKE